jgi:myo-inositol-1(or 4)-monophosphatase
MLAPSMHALLPVVNEAAELARSFFRNVTAERKADHTIVTAADRAVEEFLTPRIAALAPGARILGEEFGATGGSDAAYTITLDPIDGTAAFVAGLPTWCITIGLVHDGVAVGGLTHLPMTGETYLASGDVAEWNGRALLRHTRPAPDGDLFILTHSDYHRGGAVRFTGKIRSLGSTAYHMALVARGAAIAAVLGRPRIWDIAAGAAMLAAIGGELRYRSGAPVELATLLNGERAPEHLVAAAPGMMDEILPLIRPTP